MFFKSRLAVAAVLMTVLFGVLFCGACSTCRS